MNIFAAKILSRAFVLAGLLFYLFQPAPARPVTYTIADATGDWGLPSPFSMYARGPGYVRMSLVFDTLIWTDKEGLQPALAENWRFLPSQNSYVFKLRPNLHWHDGKPITPADVRFTFQYFAQHSWPWMDLSMVQEVELIGSGSIKVKLKEPYAPFISRVAVVMPILPMHIWQNVSHPENFKTKQAVIGSGPFLFSDYDPVQGSYLFLANPAYYLGKPKVDRLIFIKVNSEMAMPMLYSSQINASAIPAELAETTHSRSLSLQSEPPSWAAKLIINHDRPPLDQKAFRQALAFGIDRARLVSIVLKGRGSCGNPGFLPPTLQNWFTASVPAYPYQPEKSRQILRQLGYLPGPDGFFSKGKKPLELELLTGNSRQAGFGRLGELVKEMLEKIGIRIHLVALEAKVLDNRVLDWQFDLALGGNGGLAGDPDFLVHLINGPGFNSARYGKNSRLNELLREQRREMNQAKRKLLVEKIQKILAADLPVLCLYYPQNYWLRDLRFPLDYQPGGLASGIPSPLNKWAFLQKAEL